MYVHVYKYMYHGRFTVDRKLCACARILKSKPLFSYTPSGRHRSVVTYRSYKWWRTVFVSWDFRSRGCGGASFFGYGRKFPAHQSQETDWTRRFVRYASDFISCKKGSTEDMRHSYKNELPTTYQHPIGWLLMHGRPSNKVITTP